MGGIEKSDEVWEKAIRRFKMKKIGGSDQTFIVASVDGQAAGDFPNNVHIDK